MARPWTARQVSLLVAAALLTAGGAAVTKRAGTGPALAAVEPETPRLTHTAASRDRAGVQFVAAAVERPVPLSVVLDEPTADDADRGEPAADPAHAIHTAEAADTPIGSWIGEDGHEYYTPEPGHERYYNGRPIRPVRTVWMVTTAYSPDHRSCGKWADGFTASMKSVWTNGMESVAADTRLLPFGTLLSVPGYADGRVVPVLDRGGAIKGARLDVLYPTHAIARRWGVQRLPVTIWEYADGEG